VWAKSGLKEAPHKVEMILNQMHELYESDKPRREAEQVNFSSVINTWVRSCLNDTPSKAEALLLRMQQLHKSGYPDVKPNTMFQFCPPCMGKKL
jgi:hypothetical protein